MRVERFMARGDVARVITRAHNRISKRRRRVYRAYRRGAYTCGSTPDDAQPRAASSLMLARSAYRRFGSTMPVCRISALRWRTAPPPRLARNITHIWQQCFAPCCARAARGVSTLNLPYFVNLSTCQPRSTPAVSRPRVEGLDDVMCAGVCLYTLVAAATCFAWRNLVYQHVACCALI